MKILIGKKFGNLVLITIQAILTYLTQSSAEKVTVETILDLTVFGTCNVYLKMFREDQGTVDLTEKLILVQEKHRKDYTLTCIDNSTRILPMVSPIAGLFESCVLNVVVGIVTNDAGRLYNFMNDNNYTYSSAPFSTYILIPDTFNAKTVVLHTRLALVILPVRVFYLLVPTVKTDDVNLYTRPYILVCAQCDESSWEKKMTVNSDLTYISSLNFSSAWLSNDVQILNGSRVSYDITGCDSAPWRDFSVTFGSSQSSVCNDYFALLDVLVRSVGSNLTLSTKSAVDITENRFTGYVDIRYLDDPHFDEAASAWFLDVAIGALHFCDCTPKSQQQILKAWSKPFEQSVWVHLIITFLLLTLTIGAKLQIERKANHSSTMDYVVPLMTVFGLYLRQESYGRQVLLGVTSLCIGIILSQYENGVTSELVVPPPKYEHNLSSLLSTARAKVICSGEESATNPDLHELKIETQKWNIKYLNDQLVVNNEFHEKGLPLENGTSLSYFAFYFAVESELLLRTLKLENNKCHCYIIKHPFRPRVAYITFELFLRNRFASIANILRESGIIYFFKEKHREYEGNRILIKLRQEMDRNRYSTDYFVREEAEMDLIKLENLYFVFVIFGSVGFLAVNIFILEKIDWFTIYIYYTGFLSKLLNAIRSVCYVSSAYLLCIFMTIRKFVKA
jgi:hypothetical protein